MTNQEAIKILSVNGWWYTDGELKEATKRAVGALQKQIPQKPFKLSPFSEEYYCPYCDNVHYDEEIGEKISALCQVNKGDRFCSVCGQAIDWSEVEE